MKSLIIIDFQNDFCQPSGSLYVKGAEDAKKGIISYMQKNSEKFNQIIYTKDWHTPEDESFKKNGGTWPVHCLQNSEGAEIDNELFDELKKYNIPTQIFNKGTTYTHEEYGAFENIKNKDNDLKDIKNAIFCNYGYDSEIHIENENVVVCGLAGDFCVMESIKNLMKHYKFNLEILVSGISSIDGGEKLTNFIKEKNLTIAN